MSHSFSCRLVQSWSPLEKPTVMWSLRLKRSQSRNFGSGNRVSRPGRTSCARSLSLPLSRAVLSVLSSFDPSCVVPKSFSHTHKGQLYNVPLLKQMVNSGHQFIDWELIVNPSTGARQVSFGRLAGVVR